MDRYQYLHARAEGCVTVVRFLDTQLCDPLRLARLQEELLHLVQLAAHPRLLVDFTGVEFCSTALLNALLRVDRELRSQRGRLALCGMRPEVREAFRLLNLDGPIFRIHDTTARGISELEQGSLSSRNNPS